MKILKYILGVILLLVIFILGKGLLTPSITYQSEVVVNKSAKEAWAVMSDESKLSKWINGYKKSELVSGEKNTVGAITTIYIEEEGHEMSMTETITAIKPNKLMAMNFSMDMMDMDYEMQFEEKDGKLAIKSKTTTTGNGLLYKSLVSFMKGSMKEQEDINMNNLKALIDSNITNYFEESQIQIAGEN